MSRQAQAEREKQARVILGSAEAAIAGRFVEAAMTYADHPTAMRLRAMNIIYETTKERGATILIPTSMVDSMNPVVALALVGAGNRISKSERTFAADEPTVVAKSAFILPIATGDRPKSSSQASLSSWLKTSSWQQL